MQQPGVPGDPYAAGESKRRRLFAPRPPAPPYLGDTRLEAMIAAYHQVVVDRLDEGLRTIQQTAVSLMHEIANEVWRTGGADAKNVQSRILSVLARDQAIRGLIAHSDERYQALDVRVGRLEDSLTTVADASQELRDLVRRSVQALRDVMSSPAAQGIDDVRKRLSMVERYLASAFQHLSERDKALVNSLRKQTREHEALIRQEAGRIVETLEGQVESGAVAAVDRLVETVQQQVQWVNSRVERHARALAGALAANENRITELLERPSVRLDAALEGQLQALRATTQEVAGDLSRSFNERLVKLASLVRSDTEWTHRQLRERTAEQNQDLAGVLDERLGRMGDLVAAATRWAVEEIAERTSLQTARAVQIGMADLLASLDRRFERLTEGIDRQLGNLSEDLGQHAAQAVDEAMDRAKGEMETAIQEAGESAQVTMGRLLDARMGALARLIRSDNQILAERLDVIEQQAAAKQAVRAVNELAASLPGEMSHALDRRFAVMADLLHRETQATLESVVQAADAVSERVDQAATTIEGRLERDLETVIERLGDAMEALASGWGR